MLSKNEIDFLKNQGINPDDVDSFNDRTLEVKFKNGDVRTCAIAYTRVMGYHRQILHDANIGKKQEFKERLTFKEEKTNNV